MILSDSILRHVGTDCPTNTQLRSKVIRKDIPITRNPSPYHHNGPSDLKVMKLVVPGACCARLWSEALILSRDYNFEEVIVHVGTNHLSTYPDNVTFNEVTTLLTALQDLLSAKVSFSPILPRVTEAEQLPLNRSKPLSPESTILLNRIVTLNIDIAKFCARSYINEIACPEFMSPGFKHLLCKDGVHLNRRGIVALDHTIIGYITDSYWIHTGSDLH